MSLPLLPPLPSDVDREKTMQKRTHAVGYVRVSTDHQLKGVGPERQKEAIVSYAQKASVEVVTIIEECHTAVDSTPLNERPGFADAVSWAVQLNCPIYVESMDRVSRNVRVFEDWRDVSNVRIIAVCEQDRFDTAGERARIAAASVVAELRQARQAAAYERMRAEGKSLGNPNPSPLANQRSVARRKAFAAQRLQKIVVVLEEVGPDTSRPDLASELNRRGITTSTGHSWTPKLLARAHKEALAIVIEARKRREADVRAKVAQAESDLTEMSKDPKFGMF